MESQKVAEEPALSVSKGLEGIVALESSICFIDGLKGQLAYRGYDINALAKHSNFEEVCFLLLSGKLPNHHELQEFSNGLKEERALPKPVLEAMTRLPKDSIPMVVLRTAVSLLSHYDPEAEDMSETANFRKSIRLISRIATIVATWVRIREGHAPLTPRNDFRHAQNFLYLMNGEDPDPMQQKALDLYLVLVAEHELNASTFAARETAATLSDIYSAIVSAIGCLKGPLHGGANEAAMKMLLEIETPERAEKYVLDKLAKKEKIMGFGHRVYKTKDPRAAHLREMCRELSSKFNAPWYAIQTKMEEVLLREKNLHANVDFYSASVFYLAGIPMDLYPPLFAVSRIPGWCAHVLEQYRDNRLIRPRAKYIGPTNLSYIPIEKR